MIRNKHSRDVSWAKSTTSELYYFPLGTASVLSLLYLSSAGAWGAPQGSIAHCFPPGSELRICNDWPPLNPELLMWAGLRYLSGVLSDRVGLHCLPACDPQPKPGKTLHQCSTVWHVHKPLTYHQSFFSINSVTAVFQHYCVINELWHWLCMYFAHISIRN